ncbi:hypothetical protein SAMN02745157_0718 [Kaistia soli DSM 19436]|uniref:Uncharacterized protein n=1 Tax=Kaistia soli DSM 19436 TaxID=1122133 RepID=A0A1M4VJ42_9HYPH|nr:hypothetical protein [Kaistia soli]SHE68978.1 hypothetical protein SAMN02745157_0718 [Kaistia soli DSM 19436]
MTLSSMLHAILSPLERGNEALAVLNEERTVAREAHDAAMARVRRSTSDLRQMVEDTVERVGNRKSPNGRH